MTAMDKKLFGPTSSIHDLAYGGQRGPRWAFVGWGTGCWYFRIFGYGLHFKDWRKRTLMFSEREFVHVGKPILIVGYWWIKFLKPWLFERTTTVEEMEGKGKMDSMFKYGD